MALSSCQNNPEKSFAEKKTEPSGRALFRLCSFDATKNKRNYYRGKNCIENLCKGFRDVAMKKNNCKEKNDTANL